MDWKIQPMSMLLISSEFRGNQCTIKSLPKLLTSLTESDRQFYYFPWLMKWKQSHKPFHCSVVPCPSVSVARSVGRGGDDVAAAAHGHARHRLGPAGRQLPGDNTQQLFSVQSLETTFSVNNILFIHFRNNVKKIHLGELNMEYLSYDNLYNLINASTLQFPNSGPVKRTYVIHRGADGEPRWALTQQTDPTLSW